MMANISIVVIEIPLHTNYAIYMCELAVFSLLRSPFLSLSLPLSTSLSLYCFPGTAFCIEPSAGPFDCHYENCFMATFENKRRSFAQQHTLYNFVMFESNMNNIISLCPSHRQISY